MHGIGRAGQCERHACRRNAEQAQSRQQPAEADGHDVPRWTIAGRIIPAGRPSRKQPFGIAEWAVQLGVIPARAAYPNVKSEAVKFDSVWFVRTIESDASSVITTSAPAWTIWGSSAE